MPKNKDNKNQDKPKELSLYATYRIYKNSIELEKKYADFEVTDTIVPLEKYTYKQLYNATKNGYIKKLGNQKWYGIFAPKTIEELFDRIDYPDMDDYNNLYKNVISPLANELALESQSLFDDQKLKYNDLGLGIFDFNKASLGLQPIYSFYSLKFEKYLEKDEVKTVKIDKKFVYQYKLDNSKVILVPKIKENPDKKIIKKAFIEISDGEPMLSTLKKYGLKIAKFTSSIKKTYLNKEVVQKPLKSIRIFVKIGDNKDITGNQYKYTGYTAIGIANALTLLDYNVCIIGVFTTITKVKNKSGNLVEGTRVESVILKDFGENLDSQKLLYICSDASFFRSKFFINIIKVSDEYGDNIETTLGHSPDVDKVESLIFNYFGKIDKKWKPNGQNDISQGFLYFIFSSIHSEKDMLLEIRDKIRNVINENVEARKQIALNLI